MSKYTYRRTKFFHTVEIPDPDAFHKHMHNSYEIFYFVSGDAEYIIEGSVYPLKQGDLLFIHPRKFHYLNPLSDAVYERFVINFPIEAIPPELRETVSLSGDIYRIEGSSPISEFFSSWITNEEILPEEKMSEYLYYSLMAMLVYIGSLSEKATVSAIKNNPTLEKIMQYIDEHPEERLNADILSAKFYMSNSWIVHSFKKKLGISLMQYIRKKRILYAESLIRGGTSPTDAAKLCNYENYSTFYRQYRDILKELPTETKRY